MRGWSWPCPNSFLLLTCKRRTVLFAPSNKLWRSIWTRYTAQALCCLWCDKSCLSLLHDSNLIRNKLGGGYSGWFTTKMLQQRNTKICVFSCKYQGRIVSCTTLHHIGLSWKFEVQRNLRTMFVIDNWAGIYFLFKRVWPPYYWSTDEDILWSLQPRNVEFYTIRFN